MTPRSSSDSRRRLTVAIEMPRRAASDFTGRDESSRSRSMRRESIASSVCMQQRVYRRASRPRVAVCDRPLSVFRLDFQGLRFAFPPLLESFLAAQHAHRIGHPPRAGVTDMNLNDTAKPMVPEFTRIKRLPPYVFNITNELK